MFACSIDVNQVLVLMRVNQSEMLGESAFLPNVGVLFTEESHFL